MTLLAVVLILAGCTHPGRETASIPPLPAAGNGASAGLGPATQPLSLGPGYKGSPSWSPEGDRIAFTVDGYVVDKSLRRGDLRRWTTRDFGAEDAEWLSGESLAILGATMMGAGPSAGTDGTSSTLYRAASEEDSLGVKELATQVRTLSMVPESRDVVVAFETGPYESKLALLDGGEIRRLYTDTIEGSVTGISVSPDGRRAILAVRTPEVYGAFEVHALDLQKGQHRTIARLERGLEIFGAPQWTESGTYYVAGETQTSGAQGIALYQLYYIPSGSETPERAPSVGKDFVAASIQASPDGKRLAVIGRLNPKSPLNLYVVDMAENHLTALTTNEDMEIKTGPDDLAWSPDGESIAIVARGAPSGEPLVRAAPADTLLEEFYNLYEVPVGTPEGASR